jgi:hypothetical protein
MPGTGRAGKLSLTASLIEQNHGVGVSIVGAEATVEATVVRGTQLTRGGELGYGIRVLPNSDTGEGARLRLTASLVEENHRAGVVVAGSEAAVEATVVRATQLDVAGRFGYGILAQSTTHTRQGAKLSVAASLIEENHGAGISVVGSEATVEATVVRATQLDHARDVGDGIAVEGGTLSLTASLVEQNYTTGIYVGGAEATVEATVVRATQPDAAGNLGFGIAVQPMEGTQQQGKLGLMASSVEENHVAGVFVSGAEATVRATRVRATKPRPLDGEFGDGIMALDPLGPTRATIEATEVTDNVRAGVIFVGSEGILSGVRSSGNHFGLVVQFGNSGSKPELGDGDLFEGNSERDKLNDGDLPVPDAELALP